jgi:hypothetical protein
MVVSVSVTIYSSKFVLTIVDKKIPFSLLFLSESQSTSDGDGNIHTHACKYKSISQYQVLFMVFEHGTIYSYNLPLCGIYTRPATMPSLFLSKPKLFLILPTIAPLHDPRPLHHCPSFTYYLFRFLKLIR